MKHPKENAIDFPCSYVFRAYYQETFYGEYLAPLEPLNQSSPDLSPEPEWSRRQWDSVKQMKAEVLHLNRKVSELLVSRKKTKGQY